MDRIAAVWRRVLGHFLSGQARQEIAQIIGMVVDMVGAMRIGGDMYGTHPHCMGGGQIAGVILEHGGALWWQAVCLEDPGKGIGVRFRQKSRILDAVNRVKQPIQSTGLKHAMCIRRAAVGIDDLAAGQGANLGGQFAILFQMIQRDRVHVHQIGFRVQIMLAHQTGQGGAIGLPIVLPQMVGPPFVHAKLFHHIGRHPLFDLIEQPGLRGIEGVVQIEHPVCDMQKRLLGHDQTLRGRDEWRKSEGLIAGQTTVYCTRMYSSRQQKGNAVQKDAYTLILEAIDTGVYRPGDRLVESELADRFGVSRTPIREALQRLETQSLLTRDGRSLIVASLDHNQLSELYVVRAELEGLAARLAARHATNEEVRVLRDMVSDDRAFLKDPAALSRANRRFHKQIHLASHNRFLVQQLDLVHRSMALMATTSLAAEGRGEDALAEHDAIVRAIETHDEDGAYRALKDHISKAFVTRLKLDASA